jgi:6-phosphogluconolactonase (cycloisomerase 2 family)
MSRCRVVIGSLACLLLVARPARAEVDFVQVVRDGVDGLFGARAVAVSPDGFDVYVASYYEDAVAHFHRGSIFEPWRYRGELVDGVNGIDGLDGSAAIAVAPNGLYVYVAGQAEHALTTFEREPSTGALTPWQVIRDGDDGFVDGLATPTGISVVPYGDEAGRVFVSSYGDSALSIFDPVFDGLQFQTVFKNGQAGVTGLAGATSVVAVPGTHGPSAYVSAQFDNAVAVFATDAFDDFEFVEAHVDGQLGIDGLAFAQDVAASPDGASIFAAGQSDNAVAVFARNAATGELTPWSVQREGVGGVDGLTGAQALAPTPDSDHVYVASAFEPAVTIFSYDLFFDDDLGYVGMVTQQPFPIPPFSILRYDVAAAADSDQVFVANSYMGTLSVYDRDGGTGALSLETTLEDGTGVRAMRGAQSVVASPDGRHVYAMGSEGSLVSSFARGPTGALTLVGTTGLYGEDPRGVVPAYRSAAISPDGAFLYEARFRDHAISIHHRDAATGALTPFGGISSASAPDLIRPTAIAMSPGPFAPHAYAVGEVGGDGWLMALNRDVNTGALSYYETHFQGVGGVGGLLSPQAIAVSPDGSFVYVASFSTEPIAVFRRFPGGNLQFVTKYDDPQSPGDVFDRAAFAHSIAISPDGLFVYVLGDDLVWAQRSPTTGELAAPQYVSVAPIYPGELVVTSDRVYVAAYDNDGARHSALLAYARDPLSGAPTPIVERSDSTGTDSVDGAISVAVPPDGRHVYVASYQDDAVTVFTPEPGAAAASLAAIAALLARSRARVEALRRL